MKVKNVILEVISTTTILQKLYKLPLPISYMLKLKQQKSALQSTLQNLLEVKKEVAERYCDKNEDGTPKLTPAGGYSFSNPEELEKFNNEYAEFLSGETEIPTEQVSIPASVLDKVLEGLPDTDKWTTDDLEVLGEFILVEDTIE